MYLMGGSIAGPLRVKAGPPNSFNRRQPNPVEGVLDVPSGTVPEGPEKRLAVQHEWCIISSHKRRPVQISVQEPYARLASVATPTLSADNWATRWR